jgi:hypothetical protein
MSRGMGRVQRAVLAYLETEPDAEPFIGVELHRVACAVFAVTTPTDAQLASVRRAVRGLVDAGLAAAFRRSHADKCGSDDRFYEQYRSRGDGSSRRYKVGVSETHVTRPPTAAEEKAHRQALARWRG